VSSGPGGRGPRSQVYRGAVRGTRVPVNRVKLAYWALMSVLGALALFLLAAGARVLRWRLDRPGGGG
jgi:hypothetical protein